MRRRWDAACLRIVPHARGFAFPMGRHVKTPGVARADWKLFHALVNLAWRTAVHYFRALIPGQNSLGVDAFRRNYVPEGLPPATTERRALLPQAIRCTACAQCDVVCPLLVAGTSTSFEGPMAFVISGSRAAPNFVDVKLQIDVLSSADCHSCRRCEVACPERIPILALASLAASDVSVIAAARTALLD